MQTGMPSEANRFYVQATPKKKDKMKNVRAAIDHFVNSEENGEAWRKVLDFASVRARARIGLAMYYSFYKCRLYIILLCIFFYYIVILSHFTF